jgi:hypothetical protein
MTNELSKKDFSEALARFDYAVSMAMVRASDQFIFLDGITLDTWTKETITAALAPAERMQWQPIETAPKNRTVLVWYRNRRGKWRVVKAMYVTANTLECDPDEFSEDCYEEENGSYYCTEGWYLDVEIECEMGMFDYSYMRIHENLEYWMPILTPPAQEGGV